MPQAGHKKLGFVELYKTSQKHKLVNFLSSFDPKSTEAQNLFNHGYRKFWDSGQEINKLISSCSD